MNWYDSIVLISSSQTNNTIGTGFIIYQDASKTYLLTCFHVVDDVMNDVVDDVERPENLLANGIPVNIIAYGEKNGCDLAVLEVEELWNKPVLKLSNLYEVNRLFKGAGYKLQADVPISMNLFGIIEEKIQIWSIKLKKNIDGWNLTIDPENPLEEGNSGSPMIDLLSKSVVGVVTTTIGGKRGSAVSINVLKEIWPDMPQDLISSDANDISLFDLSNNTQEPRIFPLSFPIIVTAVILLVISIFSLLASYIWYSSVPWKVAYNEYGWLIEAIRSILIVLQALFLIRPYFSQEIGEFFGFIPHKRENHKLIVSIRFIAIAMSVAGCLYLWKHNLDLAPQELAKRAYCWAENKIIQREDAPTLAEGYESYYVPYRLYFLYSCITYLFLIFPSIAMILYSVAKDLLILIKYRDILKQKIKIILDLANNNSISNFVKIKLSELVENNFDNFENNYIETIKHYTYLFIVVVFIFSYELLLGHLTLSIRATIGLFIAIGIVFVALIIIFLGFLHYEDACQQATNSMIKIIASSNDELILRFKSIHNSRSFFLQRLFREFLSLSLGVALLIFSLIIFLIVVKVLIEDPCSGYRIIHPIFNK